MKNRPLIIVLIVMLGLSVLAFGQTRNSRPRPPRARDPVCGLIVDKDPKLSAEYDGVTYYFCSNADKEKFKKNPQKYVRKK
jgi:YHS domain-containing protein